MKILLAPLDWGLGHATRSLTLAHAFETLGHQVDLASCGGALKLLQQALPGRKFWDIPDYRIDYPVSRQGFAWRLAQQAPKVWRAIRDEHAWLLRAVDTESYDLIVSDGRYGLWHPHRPCVLVTHQITLLPPETMPGGLPLRAVGMSLATALNRAWLRHFTEVWIPDTAQAPGLSGMLGHPKRALPQARYLGPLNRFAWEHDEQETAPAIDILAVVSGPEPQRTLFEQALLGQLRRQKGTRVLVQGLPGSRTDPAAMPPIEAEGLTVLPHVAGPRLRALFRATRALVTRSGYTTVMELAGLGIRPVLMVPTPGQPEQEYLARQLAQAGWVLSQDQESLDIGAALPKLASLPGLAQALGGADAPGMSREALPEWLRRRFALLTSRSH